MSEQFGDHFCVVRQLFLREVWREVLENVGQVGDGYRAKDTVLLAFPIGQRLPLITRYAGPHSSRRTVDRSAASGSSIPIV